MKKKPVFLLLLLCSRFAVLSGQDAAGTANTAVPFPEEQSIEVSPGISLKYFESGNKSGTPILFLHGFTDSWRSYEKVLPLFPDTFHTLAISQRGHGNSARPATDYDMKYFATDIATLIRMKNLGPCVIVGHSMGGVIAQQFALDYPELTKALVIVSSDACFANNPGLPAFRDEINKLSDPVDYAFAEAFQKSTITRPVDPAFVKQCINESLKVPASVWKQVMAKILSANFSDELYKINIPVLILWGNADAVCFLSDQQLMKQKISQATLLIYEGTGHALHWEEPQRFTDDVTRFVNGLK